MALNEKKITSWLETKAKLGEYKALELELRKELVEAVSTPIPGTYHSETAKGKLTATVKHNFKVDPISLTHIWGTLSREEKDCVKQKPELILKPFKLLPKDSQLNKAIIETDATPTLAFKEVKDGN